MTASPSDLSPDNGVPPDAHMITAARWGNSRAFPRVVKLSRPRPSEGPISTISARSSFRFRVSVSAASSNTLSLGDRSQMNTEYCAGSPNPFIFYGSEPAAWDQRHRSIRGICCAYLPRPEYRIGWQFAEQMSGQQTGLYFQDTAIADRVAEQGVSYQSVHPPLIGCNHFAAAIRGEGCRIAPRNEMPRPQFPVVDQADTHRIGNYGTEFFHQVQCEGGFQGNRILKNNGRRGAGFRSGTTSTAFNLCWTRRIQPRQPQIQTLVVASR